MPAPSACFLEAGSFMSQLLGMQREPQKNRTASTFINGAVHRIVLGKISRGKFCNLLRTRL